MFNEVNKRKQLLLIRVVNSLIKKIIEYEVLEVANMWFTYKFN